ncbi:hypothetical protein LPB67_14205 [Undibacterium sp. Jales W-56]|uniref:hypothetical protein n=1 Tax=Undibacterium sp. Jales W-56 TaxID=2897325 RepID=UPI0021CF948B|nr:hypothetical protein [Undibacterium sp. Jales W-56]MCU6434926.1 hypothetical protein [Undibacterium sp. Jales W-56]
MKQKQLSILAASLVAAFAANVASAGQIQSSSVTLAREVIETNSQILRAPSKSYNFAGDLDARFNGQRLQVQLSLPGTAKWGGPAAGGAIGAGTVKITNADGSALSAGIAAAITVTAFVSADHKTIYANIDFAQGAANIVSRPIITFNPGSVIGTDNSGLTNLRTVAGDTGCVNPDTNMDVTFKHYTTYTSPALMTGANSDSEDQRPGAVNTGRLLNFTENVKISIAPTAGSLTVDNATLKTFLGTGAAFVSPTLANLGTVQVSLVGSGLDLDYTTVYGVPATTTPATAVSKAGSIEAKSLNVNVNLPGSYADGTVFLSATPNCAAVLGATTATATAFGDVTALIKVTAAADIDAVKAAKAYVCYSVASTSLLSQTSTSGAVDLLKAAPSSNSTTVDSLTDGVQEQKNSCSGALTPIGGGVKIDVRNYATSKIAGGWLSVIRLINPSETRTATVYGQLIHSDGSYGGWGQIATLVPRQAMNMTSSQIDALLVNAPVSNGTGFVAGATAPTANAAIGERLRVTADGVGSLRVQNYLYNPDSKNFIEASSTQGVDFDATTGRAPSDAQTVVQDAQRGLAK